MDNIISVSLTEFKDKILGKCPFECVLGVDNVYTLSATIRSIIIQCRIAKEDPATDDQTDVETNLIPLANTEYRQYVATVFERKDLTLKICSDETGTKNEDGEFVLTFRVPGTLANGDKRVVDGGKAFFYPYHPGNRVLEVEVIDTDNKFGYGAGAHLKAYYDAEMPEGQIGWRVPPIGHLEVETLGDFGDLYAELDLIIKGKPHPDADPATRFYVNLDWAKVE